MSNKDGWFEVSKEGLGNLVAGRDKSFVLYELIQNAWDQETTIVDVVLESAPDLGRGLARLKVTDDDPRGFADLTDAFTLFRKSRKMGDPTKRGRYNWGEKLALALCISALIETTTGAVEFPAKGPRKMLRRRRDKGSCFSAVIRMTADEVKGAVAATKCLLPPKGIRTIVNRVEIPYREPLLTFEAQLACVFVDEDGALRPSRRNTKVHLYEPLPGESAGIYELGLPVQTTGDTYHANVDQKVPQTMDRMSVSAAYLQELRTLVLNHTSDRLPSEDLTASWVAKAMEDERVAPLAVANVINGRFGTDAVVRDPSDPESNHRAVASGVPLIEPATLNKETWRNVKNAGVLPAAGKVFPTFHGYSSDPDAPQVKLLDEDKWTAQITEVVALAINLADKLLQVDLRVLVVNDMGMGALACFRRSLVAQNGTGELHFNVARLGYKFFDYHKNPEPVIELLLHELAHYYESNHLSDNYHAACTRLGARLAVLVAHDPDILRSI